MARITREEEVRRAAPLTQLEWDVIVGSLLGDGCLRLPNPAKSKKPCYHETHCRAQELYLRWKGVQLPRFVPSFYYSEDRNTREGIVYHKIHMDLGCADAFWPLYRAFYPDGNGHKIVPLDLLPQLTPRAVAIWYMDDGTYPPRYGTPSGNRIRSHVEMALHGFTALECGALANKLAQLFQVRPSVDESGRLRLNVDDSEALLRALRPFAAPGMAYKFS